MSLRSKIAEYKRYKGGVCHCTFNPGGPGVVRKAPLPKGASAEKSGAESK